MTRSPHVMAAMPSGAHNRNGIFGNERPPPPGFPQLISYMSTSPATRGAERLSSAAQNFLQKFRCSLLKF
jgi:hypothetical protein